MSLFDQVNHNLWQRNIILKNNNKVNKKIVFVTTRGYLDDKF